MHLNLGAKPYWPVYAEAARLGCPSGSRGRPLGPGYGDDERFTGANAIGHPMSLAIALAEMVFNNLFERFPGLRVAYLEGGPFWFLMALERFFDPMRQELQSISGRTVAPAGGTNVGDYLRALIQAGRLVIGIEGGEAICLCDQGSGNKPLCSPRTFRTK